MSGEKLRFLCGTMSLVALAALGGFAQAASVDSGYKSDTIDKVLESRNSLRNYILEFKGSRTFLVNIEEVAKDKDTPKEYQTYEFTQKDAVDRGKRMFHIVRPLAVSGEGVIEGRIDHVRQVYDGSTVTLNERPNFYIVSRNAERYGGLPTIVSLVDPVMTRIAKVIEEGSLSFEEEVVDSVHTLDLRFDERRLVLAVDADKGYSVQHLTMFSQDGSPVMEAVMTDFKEYPGGVWLPGKGEFTRLLHGGETLLEKSKFQIVKAQVNLPEVDPELFKMEIPPGASVRYEDRGVIERVPPATLVGSNAPELDVAEWVRGDPTTLAALKGKIVVLAFSDFEDEMHAELVQSLAQLLERHSTADLEIITVHASGTDADELGEFFSDHLIAYRVAVDNPSTSASYQGATFEKYRVQKLPAIFIIDAEGKVRYQDIPLEAVGEAVKRLLDEQ